MNLKSILSEIYPLHRTLSSDGTDITLNIISRYIPASLYKIEEYPALEKVWTWTIPERYIVKDAFFGIVGSKEYIISFKDNPLHLVSYSIPVNKVMDWNEFESHLYYSDERKNAIPWMYKYYEQDWGFCLSKSLFDKLPRDKKYYVFIDSEFDITVGMRISTAFIDNNSKDEMLITAHICHPMQANDDVSGVVTAIELINRFIKSPLPDNSMNVRFLFCPETIGSIAYLAHHDHDNIKGGMFLEMTGNNNLLAYHHTRQHNSLLDRITKYVFDKHDANYKERDFASAPANDERVINSPGVNIPCISINRYPYPEYHTSDDNPDIIYEDKLQDAADVAEQIIRIFASNYYPMRTYKGPLFLSGNGLWVDWRKDWNLNRAIEKITFLLEGNLSIFDIAQQVDLDYWVTREFIEKMRKKGLVDLV